MPHAMSLLALLALLSLTASTVTSFPAGSGPGNGYNAVNIPTVHPPISSPPDEFALLALDTLNKMRQASGLKPLCITAKLQKASQEHSNWMSRTQIFEHSKFGFMENIAVHGEGYYLPGKTCFGSGAEKAVDLKSSAEFTTNCQWRNSEGHYKNMMNPAHTRAGIAYAIGPFDGFKGYWWTQNFDSSDEPCIAGAVGSAPVPVAPPRSTTSARGGAQPTSTASRGQPVTSTTMARIPDRTTTISKTSTAVQSKSVSAEPSSVIPTTTNIHAISPRPTQTTTTSQVVKLEPTTSAARLPVSTHSTKAYAQSSTVTQSSSELVAPTAVPTHANHHGGDKKDKCLPSPKTDKYSYGK